MSQPRSPRWVCSMTVGMMKLDVPGGAGVDEGRLWMVHLVCTRVEAEETRARLMNGSEQLGLAS